MKIADRSQFVPLARLMDAHVLPPEKHAQLAAIGAGYWRDQAWFDQQERLKVCCPLPDWGFQPTGPAVIGS